MQNKHFILLSFFVLFLSSLYLFCRTIFDNKKNMESSLFDDETALNYMSSYLDLALNDGLKAEMRLFDVHNGSMISTEDLFKDNDSTIYFVCRIHEEDCQECTNYAMAKFFDLDSIIARNKVQPIIIGTYDSYTALKLLTPEGMLCYYTPYIDIPMDERGYPYYFVIDSSGKVFDVFSPNRNYSRMIDTYFEIIRLKWSGA